MVKKKVGAPSRSCKINSYALQDAIKTAGYTQKKIAEVIDVSAETLSKSFSAGKMSYGILADICKQLNKNPERFIVGNDVFTELPLTYDEFIKAKDWANLPLEDAIRILLIAAGLDKHTAATIPDNTLDDVYIQLSPILNVAVKSFMHKSITDRLSYALAERDYDANTIKDIVHIVSGLETEL